MADSFSTIIETAEYDGRRLRASFTGDEGVFGQGIDLVHREAALNVVKAVAGDANGDWPSSPPWQELHVHAELSGARVLMFVGRAGTSHWSMTVSVDQPQQAIVFDVACRVRKRPEFLGTTYDVAGGDVRQFSPCQVELQPCDARSPNVLLQSLGVDGSPPALVELRDGCVVVRPEIVVAPPATIRWKYCLRLAD